VVLYKNIDVAQGEIQSSTTDDNGDAFISLFGEVVITRAEPEEDNNDVFIFKILDDDNNLVNEIILSQGESKTIKIPYGSYKVIQKDDWAWRYIGGLSEDININNNNFEINIIYDEERTINKWFDSMTYIDNLYK